MRALLILSVLVAGPVVADAPAVTAAKQVVTRFYDWYLKERPYGVPSAEQDALLEPLLSAPLLKLLREARDYRAQMEKEYPDEKPPFTDECLFASLYEGPRRFEVGAVAPGQDGRTEVAVRLWGDDQTPSWMDRLVLVREGETLKIDDILFGGAGEFNPPGRLTDNLRWRESGP